MPNTIKRQCDACGAFCCLVAACYEPFSHLAVWQQILSGFAYFGTVDALMPCEDNNKSEVTRQLATLRQRVNEISSMLRVTQETASAQRTEEGQRQAAESGGTTPIASAPTTTTVDRAQQGGDYRLIEDNNPR